LAGVVQDDTPIPMAVVMLVASVLAFLSSNFLTRVGVSKI